MDINQEEQSLVDFACRVCRIKNNSCRSKKGDCAYRAIALSNYPDIIQCGDAFQVREDNWTI